ncbi:hypothetical protein PFISCL1PPCAC_28968 [Pristionchus fissidentatus]|uniref:Uncharacterized protein n=2 Tax=Pristionchus fissidentatus TaxID=1538716 RepID=A0AAV5X2B0_9BILA|nr:hypothetical protein PFISCL1PPCAC_28968 [Pristionchus fissidentatus]
MNKKVKMEDEYDEDDDDDGGPPMLNRQTSGAPAYRRACSPTCTKRCCLTEDGKRVSRQTTTGVRSDQFDPPYGSRPGGSKARKPRAPKLASETASPKGARAPYGSRKGEMMKPMIMPMSSDRGGSFGSAPGARSMQAISSGRAVSTMPQRSGAASQQGMMGMGGGGVSRVVAIGPGGKVQALPRATLSSPASALSVARPRMPAGGTLASALSAATAGGGGQTRYPVAVASTGPSSRLPGPSELVRAENTVDTQYKQTRAAFAHHVVPGSSAIEFNRVIDLLTVENKRLIAGQTDEQEYVDGLHRRIRSLENNVASLQRQLAVTTKAYHGALLELNAERDEALPPAATSVHAAPAPAAASSVFRPSGGAAGLGGGGGGAGSGVARATLASGKVVKPETKEEKPKEEEEEHEEGGLTAPAGGSSAPARVVAAPAGAGTAGGRGPVPRLLEAGSQGAGSSAAAAAAMMLNREQWMEEIEDEDEEYYDEMMEEMDDEEMSYFGEEEIVETEEGDNMGLD